VCLGGKDRKALTLGKTCVLLFSAAQSIEKSIWGGETFVRAKRVNLNLSEEIMVLVGRAITGSTYGSASEYVRALIVRERRGAGDRKARGIDPKMKRGRPRKAA